MASVRSSSLDQPPSPWSIINCYQNPGILVSDQEIQVPDILTGIVRQILIGPDSFCLPIFAYISHIYSYLPVPLIVPYNSLSVPLELE